MSTQMDRKNEHFVVAVTVTYNSAELLKNAINALLGQTYEVKKIIIVDNASNAENKKIIEIIASLSEKIVIVSLSKNSGGAGGFEAGVAYAKDNYGFDWVWLMDDDAYPTDNCLEELLKYSTLDNVGCLAPLIYGVDNKRFQLYHHKMVKRFLSKDVIAYNNVEEVQEYSIIDADAFVGPLISKEVVDKVGIPDGSLFIYGDDLEYTYRISKRFNVYLIRSAVINHKDIAASMSGSPKAWWKDYYMHRNRLLFVEKFASSGIESFIGKTFVRLGIIKRMCNVYLNKSYTKVMKEKRISILKSAMKDGNEGVSGKTLDPAEYMKWYNENVVK
jgi:rhamnopyranosyl-N-acetylglucosaminyl-diphospho-decaprenol beta-1,3/1,4-galactofuranosyltransferase